MFTKSQISDILDRIDLRRATISEDPESATPFETEENLSKLESHIQAILWSEGTPVIVPEIFTNDETEWMIEELGEKIEQALAATKDRDTRPQAAADVKSLYNAIDKLKK